METLLPLLAAGAVLAPLWWHLARRTRWAETRLAQAELRLGAQARSLGLVARELEVPGLHLMGLAARLPPDLAPGVEAEGRRLLLLAEEVSDQAASVPGRRGLHEARIPLRPLLLEAVEAMALTLGEGMRHWHIPPEAESLILLADRRALGRVLAQALARAVRETRTGDRIALRVVRAAETVALVIEDDGAGLPPGDLGEREGTRGLSFGLLSARELMRAHGGELTLEASPGIGARTWLTLPRARVMEDQPVG